MNPRVTDLPPNPEAPAASAAREERPEVRGMILFVGDAGFIGIISLDKLIRITYI